MFHRGLEVPVGVGACQAAPRMGKCGEARLWEQLGHVGTAMTGAFLASVRDQQVAQGLFLLTGCSAEMVTKVARAESAINTMCSLSALCSSPVVKATGPHPCALAVLEPDGAAGLQIHGRRQCQPRNREKEEQTSQNFSPGHKEKPCCLAWSLEECSAATRLLLVLPLPYPGPPFPCGVGSGRGDTATAKHCPNPGLCSCSNLTHPHCFQKTKEIPKQTNTKPREQHECGEMEVWGKKETGERLKPNISTPQLNQKSFTRTQRSDDTALLGQQFKNTIVEG